MNWLRNVVGIAACAVWSLAGSAAAAERIQLDRPAEREFIRDLAGMLDASSKEHIRQVCDRLLTDKATPIIVITVESMAKHGGDDMPIETFAKLLFNQWGIGHATLGEQAMEYGYSFTRIKRGSASSH